MKFLFVTDNYPPADRGGYAQLCHDLAYQIRKRGHDVTVLCSGTAVPQDSAEQVLRRLTAPVRWGDRWPVPVQQALLAAKRSSRNLSAFSQVRAQVKPDAILLWPTGNADQHLLAAAEGNPDSVAAYYVAGVSPTDPTILEQYWRNRGRSTMASFGKRLLHPILGHDRRFQAHLPLRHVMCVSDYERRRVVATGIPQTNTCVVHNGIDLDQFPFLGLPSVRRRPGQPLRVLYAGRLVEDKGAHTVVDAIAHLKQRNPSVTVTATLLGTGLTTYIQRIDSAIASHHLEHFVWRREWMPRSDMPALLADHDVLVLPTIRPEALSRAVQEAMATGLVVVATPTGGTPEIVADEQTGLIFPPADAAALAQRLALLSGNSALGDRLATAARDVVVRSFTLAGMADRVLDCFADWRKSNEMSGSEQ